MKLRVKVARTAGTAPWSVPVKTTWTAHRSTGLASAKRVKQSDRGLFSSTA